MKKLFTLLMAMVFVSAVANAQFTHRFDVDMVRPTGLTSSNPGGGGVIDTILFRVIVAQGSITAGIDTLGIGTSSGVIRLAVTNNSYATGDTLGLRITNDTIGIPANAGTYSYCGSVFMFDRSESTRIASTFDTTGWRSCIPLTVNWATSVDDILSVDYHKSVKIKVYPNPAVGNEINLDYVAQSANEVVVNIYDISGRKVLSQNLGNAYKGQKDFSIDISAINKGMYILELRQDGIKATGQFVK